MMTRLREREDKISGEIGIVRERLRSARSRVEGPVNAASKMCGESEDPGELLGPGL